MEQIALSKIHASKTNPRKSFEDNSLKELVESIKIHGLIQAIILRKDSAGYEIVCGERRFRAAKLAGLKEISSEVKKLSDEEVLELQLIENIQREDLTIYEEADSFGMLREKNGLLAHDIAIRTGKKESHIVKAMQLLKIAPDIYKQMREKNIPFLYALEIARLADVEQQKKSFKWLTSGDHTLGEFKSYILNSCLLKLSEAPFSKDDAKLKPAAGACTACPYRSGSNSNLFDDLGKTDFCTMPSCFSDKVTLWWQETMKNSAEDGTKIATPEELAKMFPYENSSFSSHTSGYMELDGTCWDAPVVKGKNGKHPTYKHLVGKHVDVFLARNIKDKSDFKVYRVAKQKDVEKALIENYKWAKKELKSSVPESKKETRKKERDDKAMYYAAAEDLLLAVKKEKPSPVWLRKILLAITEEISVDKIAYSLNRRGMKNDYETRHKDFKKIVTDLKDDELLSFFIEIYFCFNVASSWGQYTGGLSERGKKILSEYKITPKKIVVEKVKKEIKKKK